MGHDRIPGKQAWQAGGCQNRAPHRRLRGVAAGLVLWLAFGGGIVEAHAPDWAAHLLERLLGIARARPPASPGWLPPQAAPPFRLDDQDGQQVALEDLRGQVVLLHFFATPCDQPCRTLFAALKALGLGLNDHWGARVQFLGITLTPERDSPAALQRVGRDMGIDHHRRRLLTGPPHVIRALVDAYGVYVGSNGHHHGNGQAVEYLPVVLLIDRQGAVRKRVTAQVLNVWGRPDVEWLMEEDVP